MKRTLIIWIIYVAGILAAFFLSSCAGTKPKYVASKAPVNTQASKGKGQTVFMVHFVALVWVGVIYHFTNEESN